MALYYITFGSRPEFGDYNLQFSPAAKQKSDYIISVLDRLDISYNVISLSRTGNRKLRWYPSKSTICGSNGSYTVWGMIGKPAKVFGGIQKIIRKWQLSRFLASCEKEDVMIVYHSLFISRIVTKARKKIGFNLVLELEELYRDVVKCRKRDAKAEDGLIKAADAYVLATSMLEKRINGKKHSITINGTYRVQTKIEESFGDGKIHCVYAGTFDPTKGGLAAIDAAAYLSSKYHMHLLGFGTPKQITDVKAKIAEIQKRTECTITFDGLKSGEDYIRFLQRCQIGLCTQLPDAKYGETSFPSKILVYLANGLRVLAVRIPAIEQSSVGDLLYFYDNQSPVGIANAIKAIDVSKPYDSRSRLEELDQRTIEGLRSIVSR